MKQSILVWLLFEEEGAVLLGKRRRPPLEGQWTLPGDVMAAEESAEETLERYAGSELGVRLTANDFEDTVYLTEGGENYVTNVFRVGGYEGTLRFRREGDLEDARFVLAEEMATLTMPGALRSMLLASEPGRPPGTPDNRASWDAISALYQAQHQLKTDAVHYGPRMPTEQDLRLLGGVQGKRVLEIGCGGGQCAIAFAKEGAIVTGIDQSAAQLAFARQLATTEGVKVDFVEGDITRLPQVKTASQDAVFSAHALSYVEDMEACFAEVYRVLRPAGLFVFSTGHPVRAMLSEADPLRIDRSYWDEYQEWEWGEGSGVWMRSWDRTVEGWFSALRGAGFEVDRVLEPRMLSEAHDESWDHSGYSLLQGQMAPTTLIFRALKPA